MTNKDKVKYLKQYKELDKEIVENENRYATLRARITAPSIQQITDMPKGTDCNKDKICNAVAELMEMEEIMRQQQDGLFEIRKNIQLSINGLEDSLHRRIMTIKYIDGKNWEEVCCEIKYSWRQTHRKHSDALSLIKIIGGNVK